MTMHTTYLYDGVREGAVPIYLSAVKQFGQADPVHVHLRPWYCTKNELDKCPLPLIVVYIHIILTSTIHFLYAHGQCTTNMTRTKHHWKCTYTFNI